MNALQRRSGNDMKSMKPMKKDITESPKKKPPAKGMPRGDMERKKGK